VAREEAERVVARVEGARGGARGEENS
jgi:hypothetical protein